MEIDAQTTDRIERVINTIESGTPEGNYSAISIYNDGINKSKQITYGCKQTTEQGNLKELIQLYVSMGGKYAPELTPYIDKIGNVPLFLDTDFIGILKLAGHDEIMRHAQDGFFDSHYFVPAMNWAKANGFELPLSKLVVFDSFIQSGHILTKIRNMFAARVPVNGGDEKLWIISYLKARKIFLENFGQEEVQKSVYRVIAYQKAVDTGNWDLHDKIKIQNYSI